MDVYQKSINNNYQKGSWTARLSSHEKYLKDNAYIFM